MPRPTSHRPSPSPPRGPIDPALLQLITAARIPSDPLSRSASDRRRRKLRSAIRPPFRQSQSGTDQNSHCCCLAAAAS